MGQTVRALLEQDGRVAEVVRELARRRADLVPHARGSLEEHLVGAHGILARWNQPERVRLAGLLHSAYSTEAFRFRLFGRRDRSRVRELVGVDAERLVFAFCGCKRRALVAAAEDTLGVLGTGEPSALPTRWKGETVRLSARDVAELLILHAANLAEQTCLPRGAPSRWLAEAARLLTAARTSAEVAPPIPGEGGKLPTRAEETALLRAYRRLLPRRTASEAAPEVESFASSPVGEPLVLAAILALAARRGEEAVALGERAHLLLESWGVAWDKRLRLERWLELAALVVRDGRARDQELEAVARRAAMVVASAQGSPQKLWAQLDALDSFRPRPVSVPVSVPVPVPVPIPVPVPVPPSDPNAPLPLRFSRYLSGLRTNAERPLLQFYPGLRAQPWYDPRDFPIVADLERLAPAIAAEAKAFDPGRFQDEAEDIGRAGRWSVLFLLEMGRRNEENLARCPAIRSILERHRTLTTHAGLMYFSCLDPGTRVAPHQGPTNLRLRCHLGLEVPERCGIRVGGTAGVWEEGRCLVFDDSFRHDVWNESDRRRVVLVLDLWHPDLDDDEVALLAGLHRYGAANGLSAQRYWARNDAALRRARAPEPAKASSPADRVRALDESIGAAMRAGDLPLASERAARYAELCRGTRWYPVRRESDPELPASVAWAPVLTPSKLLHDIEQFEYLRDRGVLESELAPLIRRYDGLLDTIRPLGENARVPLLGAARAEIGHAYNRLIHVRPTPRVPRALSRAWEPTVVEAEYLDARPSVVVVDRFLSPEAIESLRLFCLESTVWSTNRYDHGRLGSFFRDGFNSPLLIQIAEELRAAFPRIIGARHPVTQLWGYKYASSQPSLPPHADFAAVNVNFWITPDDANLAPGSGGLDLYDVEAPKDWDFPSYNRNAGKIRALLEARNARARHIPYRFNRAVIFDSDLFHATPALSFRAGYENRRINVTALFGDRLRA